MPGDEDDKVVPLHQSKVLLEVGGLVDQSSVTLCVYGESLRPSEVTALLRVEPTDSFERGYKKKPSSRPMPHGAWFFEARGSAPQGPDELARTVLLRFSVPPKTWAELNARYDVQIRIALHVEGWNKGFEFSSQTARLMAATRAKVGFDLYCYGDEGEQF
jgi:hypothetical protein